MSVTRSVRRGISSTLAAAIVIALVGLVPSIARPQLASAQTGTPFTCPGGQVIYPSSGQTCPTTGTTNTQFCPATGQYIAVGAFCSSTSTNSQFCPATGQYIAAGGFCSSTGTNSQFCPATGQYIAAGSYCSSTSTNSQFCPATGQYVAAGSFCSSSTTNYGTSSYGSGTCASGVGQAFGGTCTTGPIGPCASVQLTVGESCASNGMITCNGQAIAPGAACGAANTQLCARTATSFSAAGCVGSGATAALAGSQTMTCPGGGFASVSQGCGAAAQVAAVTQPASASVSAPTPSGAALTTASATIAAAAGFSVNFPAGWNIVAGPAGSTLPGVSGPLFTFQAGDTDYETIAAGTPLRSGVGYWAYVGSATASTIATAGPGSVTVPLPAGQPVMIGNPGNTMATVTGADSVLVYNPSTNGYNQTAQLAPGQGGWAVSMNGGQVTIATGTS